MCNSNHYVVRFHLYSAAVQYCKGRSINTLLWLWLKVNVKKLKKRVNGESNYDSLNNSRKSLRWRW